MGLDLDDTDDSGQPSKAEKVAALVELGRDVDGADSIRAMLEKIPNARHLVLAEALRCLGAKKRYFEKGSSTQKFEPDYRTRLDAVKLLLAYMDGLPVETTLAVNVGDRPAEAPELDLAAAVQKSPALRERLEKLLGPKRVTKALRE